MRINTLYLPGFSHRLCGSRARAVVDLTAPPLDGLAAVVARFIPTSVFAGAGQRLRVFTPWVTFCAFLGQSLQRGASCRDAVRRVQAWCLTEARQAPDDNTAAYCQARARLPLLCLRKAHARLVEWLDAASPQALWQGRVAKLIDGCGYSMPDTRANRAEYPYAGCQKPGCGFPTAKLVGLFPWPPATWCAAPTPHGRPTRSRWPGSWSAGCTQARWWSPTGAFAAGA